MINRYYFKFILGVLFLVLLMVSCTGDPSSVDEEPPQIPPASSMSMDFSEFQSQQKRSGSQVQSADNFIRAVGTAVILKTVVDLNLVLPRTLLAAAKSTDPELSDDEEWEWTYSKSEGDATYAVRLVASRDDESVNWEFYVTNSEVGLEDKLFFTGTTNTDGTEGTWSYYNLQADSQEQVSQIEWTVDGEDDVSLRLDITSDRNGHQGDYIDYTFDGTLKKAIYYDSSDDEETELQINVDTKEGYIVAPDYNGGEKACWDENLQDVACS